MHSLFQFLAIYGAEIALAAGMILVLLWGFSIDGGPDEKKAASTLLWWAFWPVIWLYCWLTGKNAGPGSRRIAHSSAKTATSQHDAQEQSLQRFRTIRDAKEYLVGVIAGEAERDGTALTEVERKMLYFTESGWTLPDMKEISSEFDRDYDQSKYEQKIGSIISAIQARFTDEHQQERMTWERALEKLSEGDHYLLVLADAANPPRKGVKHNLKLLILALVFLALAALDMWFRRWILEH